MTRVRSGFLVLLSVVLLGLLLGGCGTVAEAPDGELSVACVDGCVATIGYWKTHSEYGPAGPPDPVWDALLPDGPDTAFFSSGLSYYEMLHAKPRGDPYVILAHQWIAADLNRLGGAVMTPYIGEVFSDYAQDWFETMEPDDPFWREQRELVTFKAEVLDEWNNGLRNVPSCD
jgi:hypothetical protein